VVLSVLWVVVLVRECGLRIWSRKRKGWGIGKSWGCLTRWEWECHIIKGEILWATSSCGLWESRSFRAVGFPTFLQKIVLCCLLLFFHVTTSLCFFFFFLSMTHPSPFLLFFYLFISIFIQTNTTSQAYFYIKWFFLK